MKTFVIDDDQSNRQMVREMLEREGHRTQGFETADHARSALLDLGVDCDLVVTDVHMPGHDGIRIDLALALVETRPDLPRHRDVGSGSRTCPGQGRRPDRTHAAQAYPPVRPPRRGRRCGASRDSGAPPRTKGRFADPTRAIARMFCEAQVCWRFTHRVRAPCPGGDRRAVLGLHDLALEAGVDRGPLRGALLMCCAHPKVAGEAGAMFRTTWLVAVASHVASAEGCREVEPRHLVRALLTAPDAVAWAGLDLAGLNYATIWTLTGRRVLLPTETQAPVPADNLTSAIIGITTNLTSHVMLPY